MSEVKETVKPKPGMVVKNVLKPKKTLAADDGLGEWEVVGKRATKLLERPEDSSSDYGSESD